MKRRWVFLNLAILLTLFLSCASGHQQPLPENQQIVRSISSIENRLISTLSSCDRLSINTIGQVRYGDYEAPIWVVSFTPEKDAEHRVLLSGGIHGNEPAGVEIMVQMVEAIAAEPQKYDNIALNIIPIVNPWGWSHDIRYNQEGRDVNRDFASFNCPESRIIREFTRDKKYDLIIDNHEDPDAKGYYMYQYANPDTLLSMQTINTIKKQGFPIEQDVNMVILKTDDGLINAPLWGLWYMTLSRQLSITNFFRLNNSTRVYTIETPTCLVWEDRLKIQKTALVLLIDSLQAKTP